MVLQVGQVGHHGVLSFAHHDLHDLGLIICFGFSLFNGNGPLGTVTQAGTQSVAHQVADQSGFPIDHLQGSFMAIRDALSASVA